MAKDEHMGMCGMHLCGKCGKVWAIFGILFLVMSLGLWSGAPAWWNPWTLIGLFLIVGGLGPMMMKNM